MESLIIWLALFVFGAIFLAFVQGASKLIFMFVDALIDKSRKQDELQGSLDDLTNQAKLLRSTIEEVHREVYGDRDPETEKVRGE